MGDGAEEGPADADADADEALARQLQEQEDALARGGRTTRGALKVTLKVKGPPRDGSDAKGPNRSRGAVRSSSRLRPQTVESKQRPSTRGSAGAYPPIPS